MLDFKFDENLDARWRRPLEAAGHRVSTAAEEGLKGAGDPVLAQVCQAQQFCLVTADLDFAQTLEYPPESYSGLVLLRHPRPTLAGMENLLRQVAMAVAKESPVGRLWIAEPGRIRIHEPPVPEQP